MRACPRCGQELVGVARFCTGCGAPRRRFDRLVLATATRWRRLAPLSQATVGLVGVTLVVLIGGLLLLPRAPRPIIVLAPVVAVAPPSPPPVAQAAPDPVTARGPATHPPPSRRAPRHAAAPRAPASPGVAPASVTSPRSPPPSAPSPSRIASAAPGRASAAPSPGSAPAPAVPPPSRAAARDGQELTADLVRATVEAHQDETIGCYERTFGRRRDAPSGRVDVTFFIGREGRATLASAVGNSTGSPELARCLVALVGRLRFPRGPSSGFGVTYPFIFSH